MIGSPANAFHRLRAYRLARSTKPFVARGHAVERCEHCLLARRNCICAWRVETESQVDLVILMHSDEVFKPTNTGRLIVDTLPRNTFVFEWSRTEPEPALRGLLADASRRLVVLFPAEEGEYRINAAEAKATDARLTVVVLDGTWRQASRMFRLSPWLNCLPRLALLGQRQGEYAVRAALRDHQLSTAEAAAQALAECGDVEAAEVLDHYFSVFNQHYLASRRNTTASHDSPAHAALQRLGQKIDGS